MVGFRKSPSKEFPKKSRAISFVGKEGYDLLEFYDREGEKFPYGKSGLIMELLSIYQEAVNVYGRDEALDQLKRKLRLDREAE